jgi:aminopeptidase
MTADELRRYAETIVRECISFGRDDTLVIHAAPAHRELVVALATTAYAARGLAVDVVYADARVDAARITHGTDAAIGHVTPWESVRMAAAGKKAFASIHVVGDADLDVAAGLDATKLALETRRRRERSRALDRARADYRLRTTVCAWPTDEWAQLVYPGVAPQRAARALATDLLSFCRLRPDDPPHAWRDHLALLRRRSARLTKLDLDRLEVKDSGTDLTFRFAQHTVWRGGGEKDAWGRRVMMNIPHEENFVSPDAAATDGTFQCSRPRSIAGRILEGLSGEFRNGRLVRLQALRAADRDWFAEYLAAIPGAERVGEIALVDGSSRIGGTGRTYYSALIDENAAAHFAFGAGYAKTRSVPLGSRRYGVNRSATHIDVMIGTDALEATGITRSGRRVPLIRDGAWQI